MTDGRPAAWQLKPVVVSVASCCDDRPGGKASGWGGGGGGGDRSPAFSGRQDR